MIRPRSARCRWPRPFAARCDNAVDEAAFRALVSGERRGAWPALARIGLYGLAGCYALGAEVRNRAFDAGWLAPSVASIPVVSLGNLTTGGTGKTPLAAYVARWFRERSVRVAFLSRGYGAASGEVNDEALVLDQLCPDVPHLQHPDRVAAAMIAREELESQLVILDDGFQHRRLARDLDIVLVDALNPWGFGHLLPRGLLRERVSSLRRADLVVLTRADQCAPRDREAILARIARIRPGDACVEVAFPPLRLIDAAGNASDFATLEGTSINAFCGIGNPDGFRRMLAEHGLAIASERFRVYPDHHRYSRTDIEDLRQWARATAPAAVLTTQKDLVKIALAQLDGVPLRAVEIGVRVLANAERFEQALLSVLRRVPADEPAPQSDGVDP